MATRNRTVVFTQFRSEKKSFRGMNTSTSSTSASVKLLSSGTTDEDTHDVENPTNKPTAIPPGWMSIIDDVNFDITQIKQNMEKLTEFHKNHLLPQFEDDINDEDSIKILTEGITQMFHKAQGKIQKLGQQKVKNSEEESIRKNIQQTLATQVQKLSVEFRTSQRDYLQRLRGRQTKGRVVTTEDDEGIDEEMNVGFTNDQMNVVMLQDDLATQRQQDIAQIVKSIKELASIFNDLALLVVEQGTILDRIDHNIDTVQINVDEGVKQLKQANTYQKSYRKKLCMLLLCIGILIMVVVVIMRGVFK